jgi:hypothetical protein
LELPNGTPSADTFSRVFARLKPSELQKCFIGWMEEVHEVTAYIRTRAGFQKY